MARVNITVPDDVIARARAANLNVSRVATSALEEALERLIKLKELEDYLAELERELGPVPPEEQAAAAAWVDEVLAAADQPRPSRTRRARGA